MTEGRRLYDLHASHILSIFAPQIAITHLNDFFFLHSIKNNCLVVLDFYNYMHCNSFVIAMRYYHLSVFQEKIIQDSWSR